MSRTNLRKEIIDFFILPNSNNDFSHPMKLSELKTGESGIIVKILGHGEFRHRITEMGFVRGKEVFVVRHAPLQDPIEYKIMDYNVSLRHTEAELIEVITTTERSFQYNNQSEYSIIDTQNLKRHTGERGKEIIVALVGNPNCGKTTLFNALSGSREKVGNYSGVTVDAKQTTLLYNEYTISIVDLPGTYSLSAFSPEELFVRNFIFDKLPDIVLNVVDAGNLERNLYLTTQLIDMDIKVILALNMYDEMINKGARLQHYQLASMLGIPMIPTVGNKSKGIELLLKKIVDVFEDRDPVVRHIHINYGAEIERSIEILEPLIRENSNIVTRRSPRYIAIRLLESDAYIRGILTKASNFDKIHSKTKELLKIIHLYYNEKPETVIADARYGFIAGALRETYKEAPVNSRQTTEVIDTFLTHRLFGFPIFFLFMFLMFYATFNLGEYPMSWIESGISELGTLFSKLLPYGMLRDLIIDGIINGTGSVLVFLPNILILFFFISLMEDTGYMARAAFIMDKVMHKIGLHGKSFIPLIMGFGCNVPAIIGSRIIENRRDRFLTILITPFMSCSARLPVYILIIGAFFPKYPAMMLMGIYLLGILLAIATALIFKNTLFKTVEAPFVMELPPYRLPSIRVVFLNMWDKSFEYLRKVGGTILIAVIIIWALGYFPKNNESEKQLKLSLHNIENSTLSDLEKTRVTDSLINSYKLEILSGSYLKKIGETIEPVMAPAGMDWKLGISVITGIAAKEVIISTMSVIYQLEQTSVHQKLLQENLAFIAQNDKTGKASLQAMAFLIFVLIYFPCIGVVFTVKNETRSWKYPIFLVIYTTILAWFLAVLFFQVGSLII